MNDSMMTHHGIMESALLQNVKVQNVRGNGGHSRVSSKQWNDFSPRLDSSNYFLSRHSTSCFTQSVLLILSQNIRRRFDRNRKMWLKRPSWKIRWFWSILRWLLPIGSSIEQHPSTISWGKMFLVWLEADIFNHANIICICTIMCICAIICICTISFVLP